MKRLKGKSVLYSYLASFISIAMLSCTIIGMIGYMLGAQELRKSAEEEQHKRLMLAAEDMSAQFGHLQEISYTIQVTDCYQPYFIAQNPYYEVELIKDFKKFSHYSSLYDQYIFHYEGKDGIYLSTGKAYLDHYAEKKLGLEDCEALRNAMDTCTAVSFFKLDSGTLVMFPLRMAPLTQYSGRATVSFHLTNDAVIKRAQLVSGEKFTRMALYYNGTYVAGSEGIENTISVQHNHFTLVFDEEELNIGVNSHFCT